MNDNPEIDVQALVREIQGEVARRRAAGEYPQALLRWLETPLELHLQEEAPESLMVILSARPLKSGRRFLGPIVDFGKRVTRRLLAWYVHPIASDQSRFNAAILREVRSLEARLRWVETPTSRPLGAPSPEQQLPPGGPELLRARAEALAAAVRGAEPVLVFGAEALAAPLLALLPDAVGARATSGALSPLSILEDAPLGAHGSVILAGILPCLNPAELLAIVPLAARAVRQGGLVVIEAPDPSQYDPLPDPSRVELSAVRWLHSETALLLLEAAGLRAALVPGSGAAWYLAVGRRPPA